MSGQVSAAFDAASTAVEKLHEIDAAHAAVVAATPGYRPILTQVRHLQKQILALQEQISLIQNKEERVRNAVTEAVRAKLEARRKTLEAQLEETQAAIPANWDKVHADFAALLKAEDDSRKAFQAAADKSYQGAEKLLRILEGNEKFAALEGELQALAANIETQDVATSIAALKALEQAFSGVPGTNDVKKALGAARRELKRKTPHMDKVMKNFNKALEAYAAQKEWRSAAATSITPQLQSYLAAITPTLGARSQKHLTRDQALSLASCTARPKDISLQF